MAPTKVPKKPLKSMEKPIDKPISKSKKMKKKNYQSFSIYLFKLLRSVTKDNFGISRHSMLIMNNFVNDMLEKIASEAGKLVSHGKKTTLGSREIQSAIRLLIPGELAKHANIEGMKAITMYHNSTQRDEKS
ncbi:late histone H2B.L4-like [Danaus plexippus]|uniref:Histone H2B type 1-C/E/G like protein n=1 Tax=Danaus plexippus plexippus TaxID=278856 RepID=A0A212ERC6_DANPL|nr:late histone H2B.L4-like [Danaus plexippus]OWR44004.1 histone H2B type 1-C/E/G like protein [Danaus plexippus plexippus]